MYGVSIDVQCKLVNSKIWRLPMAVRTERRLPLSRDQVLRAALHLADEDGIESLSMRKLGQALGVEAMALYNHVANNDDLLDGMAALVLSEFELPDSSDEWEAA